LLATDQQKIHQKLVDFNELYDKNQKMLTYGRKINELIFRYFQTKNKKQLVSDFMAFSTSEHVKYLKKITSTIKKISKSKKLKAIEKREATAAKLKKVESEVLKEVAVIKEIELKKIKKKAQQIANYKFEPNDRVRLIDSNATGTITRIEKNKVFINYGIFTTTAKLSQIELVTK